MPSTTLVTHRSMLEHKCEWDVTHIERPDRLKVILDCLENGEVSGDFTRIEGETAAMDDILLVHTKDYVEKIRQVCKEPIEKIENFCEYNEDIYLNKSTFDCAMMSAGSSIQAMKAVLGKKGQNSFAAVRPPGHHAWQDAPCGFCIFNNVAICAKKALQLGCQKVLIVDWDVHAGQGTQYCIAGDERIQLISSHRYEEGRYWPQLPESGIRNEYLNTTNLPINEVGVGDAEYIYFLNHFILPLIDDFKPNLILVSCGFDAALGDPEGEMKITPAGYGILLGHLAAMEIPLCVLLEGGYFLESIKENFKFCMKALINKKPPLPLLLEAPSESFKDQVLRLVITHQAKFPTFRRLFNFLNEIRVLDSKPEIEMPVQEYYGKREFSTPPFQTRNVYPPRPEGVEDYFRELIKEVVTSYDKIRSEVVATVERFDITNNNNEIRLRFMDTEITIEHATEEDIALIFYVVVQDLQSDFRKTAFYVNDLEMTFPIVLNQFRARLGVRGGIGDKATNRKIAEFLRDVSRRL
uniref:Hist_deacetyl domain-containing protein n=1 Tax=Steinernema glaseri TaxID=37863 RepID=A0A1I7YDI8_9BILA